MTDRVPSSSHPIASVPRLILASGSPRRRELLGRLGLPFVVETSDEPEDADPALPPERLVMALAERKARAVAARSADAGRGSTREPGETLVLGGDTVVALYGETLGKPRDAADNAAMLRQLSGRSHEVWTGLALVDVESGRMERHAVPSVIRFRELAKDDIADYAADGEGLDKAGGYAIQGGAAGFVAAIHGCWTNVVGLPLCEVAALLRRFGVAVPGPRPVCLRPDGSACPRLSLEPDTV
jgi:septum formation protein